MIRDLCFYRDAKPTQHIEITHPHNVNSKLAFHKVASIHQHYSTFTLQTYHHPEHRFRSLSTQMTSPSHLHTQERVQSRNTYIFAWTIQNNLILNPDKTCTLFTPDPAEYKSNLDLKMNHCTTHGKTPRGSGPYLRPKTHIQHTNSQHLSTSTQATTNDKSTHSNRMG